MKPTTNFHLVPMIRISGALPPLSHYLLDVLRNSFVILSPYEVLLYIFLLRNNLFIIGPQKRYFVSQSVLYLVTNKKYLE